MTRPNGVFKIRNEYSALITDYDRIPKAVFAAVAASFANMVCCEDDLTQVNDAILNEWKALYEAGIVPQKPIREAK